MVEFSVVLSSEISVEDFARCMRLLTDYLTLLVEEGLREHTQNCSAEVILEYTPKQGN